MVLRLIRTGFLNSIGGLPVSRTCQIFANLFREITLYLRRSLFVNSQHIRSFQLSAKHFAAMFCKNSTKPYTTQIFFTKSLKTTSPAREGRRGGNVWNEAYLFDDRADRVAGRSI